MTETYNVAIVGASTLVGEAIISILGERKFPIAELFPLDSERFVGETVMLNNRPKLVSNLAEFDFSNVQIAFFCAGESESAKYATVAAETGCVVIDNSACFRQDADIPLVIPEVNGNRIADHMARNIIASPNCAITQMLMVLKPIYDAVGIERINVATYQSVSSLGKKGVEQLAKQTARLLNGQAIEQNEVFSKQVAFNVIPQVDTIQDNGYTREEMSLVLDTRKILKNSELIVSPSCVIVPVFYGQSAAIHVETSKKLSGSDVKELLENSPGLSVIEGLEDGLYPTPVSDSVGGDEVLIGRIREDISLPHGINLWVVSDNIRKGAALNSVQIAEILIKDYI